MAAMMLNQRTSGFVGTPTVSKSASRTTTRTTFTIESGLSTTDRNNKRSRIGKQPISVPKGVTYDLKEGSLKVKVRILNSFSVILGGYKPRIRVERGWFRESKTSNFCERGGFSLSKDADDVVVVGWKLIPSFLRRTTQGEKRLSKIKTHHRNISLFFSNHDLQGPKGELSLEYPAEYISMKVEGEQIVVDRTSSTKKAREQHALYRTLANNMFVGVSTGFERKLKLVGVGYKAAMQGSKAVSLSLGKAHPDVCEFPAGVTVKVDSPTELTVSGYDKSEVGNFAAIIRSKRKPEPYKGKGIRYSDEVVIQKEGKRK